MRSQSTLCALLVVCAAAVGCGDSKEPNTGDDVATATATATATADMPPVDTQPTATATATASTPPAPKYKGPGPVGAFSAGAAKAAKPGTKLAVALKPEEEKEVRAKLDAAVETHGEGTAFDGQPAAGRFKQGEALEFSIVLQPGKCYTLVAVSAEGITELDASVMVAPPMPGLPSIPAITDNTKGPDVTIGAGAACSKSPLPTAAQGTLQIKAAKGAGVAAVQVLVK